ncbi:hypothetical protein MMC30_008895 [Trapelia coarctata]|nr:hypothetical protein [Trapelia coarctata]
MGRKPNQLITEFFIRGPKLEDASNRYEYTCKACGEHFPKGRMDTLMTHLTRKCMALSLEDRHRALSQLPRTSEQAGSVVQNTRSNYDLLLLDHPVKEPAGQTSELAGLEALAEASRQVEHPRKNGQNRITDESTIDPSLKALESYNRLFDSVSRPGNHHATLGSGEPDTFQALSSNERTSPSAFKDGNLQQVADTRMAPHDLTSIAASATSLEALLPLTQISNDGEATSNARPFDTYSEVQALRPTSTWPQRRNGPTRSLSNGSAVKIARASTYPRAIAMNVNRASRGSETDGERPHRNQKIRGKFSDLRRKEVQEVRKKGACIRCRMLRKTCSDGDPCSTCANVESARLWKMPCMRTRVASEFELYSAGLHERLAQQDLDAVRQQYCFRDTAGHIVLSHLEDCSVYMDCRAVAGDAMRSDSAFPDPSRSTPAISNESEIWLLGDTENDAMGKLTAYAKELGPILLARELSQFMKATMHMASRLGVEKKDDLLAQAIDLWTYTTLLLDFSPQWRIHLDIDPSTEPHPPQFSNLPILHNDQYPTQHNSILAQLRALTERKAAKLSHRLFNELEKRLLQRPQCQGFETFLVAVLILSCVERMCWLFHTWDTAEFAGSWPLEHPSSHYTRQGDSFSDLIVMLLKMRGVLPKTVMDAEGYLGSADRENEAAVEWFEVLKLSGAWPIRYGYRLSSLSIRGRKGNADEFLFSGLSLAERANAPFDAANPACWDLKYCSKLLLS